MKSPFDLSPKASTLSAHLLRKNSSPSRPLSSRKLLPNMFLLISAMEVVAVDPFQELVLADLSRERGHAWMDERLWILGKDLKAEQNEKWERKRKKSDWWDYIKLIKLIIFDIARRNQSLQINPKRLLHSNVQQTNLLKPWWRAKTWRTPSSPLWAHLLSLSTFWHRAYFLRRWYTMRKRWRKRYDRLLMRKDSLLSFVVCRRNCVRLPLSRKSGIFWTKNRHWKWVENLLCWKRWKTFNSN